MLFSLAAVELVQAVCCLRVITHCAFKPGRQLWPNNLLPFYQSIVFIGVWSCYLNLFSILRVKCED